MQVVLVSLPSGWQSEVFLVLHVGLCLAAQFVCQTPALLCCILGFALCKALALFTLQSGKIHSFSFVCHLCCLQFRCSSPSWKPIILHTILVQVRSCCVVQVSQAEAWAGVCNLGTTPMPFFLQVAIPLLNFYYDGIHCLCSCAA